MERSKEAASLMRNRNFVLSGCFQLQAIGYTGIIEIEGNNMAGSPAPHKGASYTITTHRQHALPRCRKPRRLFSRRGSWTRLKASIVRWKGVYACFVGAALLIVGICLLSLPYFSSAAASIDTETKASKEAAYLQGGTNELVRSVSLAVPSVSQYPELPTGCESVALTNVLLSYGFNLDKTDIADKWLPTSEQDFVCAFLGDPRTPEGHSCMAPGLTGASFEDVLKEVAEQHPVIIWCTIGLETPGDCYLAEQVDGRLYRLITNSHCVVVNGYDLDSGTVFVSDPLVGQATYPLEKLAARYYALRAQAVVIR